MVHNVHIDLLDFKQTKGLVLRDNLACLIAVQVDRKPIRVETKLFSNLSGRKTEGENAVYPVCSFKTENKHGVQKQDIFNKKKKVTKNHPVWFTNVKCQIITSLMEESRK